MLWPSYEVELKEGTVSEEKGHEEAGAEGEESAKEGAVVVPDDFDPERAMRTIATQREAEKKLKDEKAELLEALKGYQKDEEAEADKQKSLEQKIAERDTRIRELEDADALKEIKSDFVEKAIDRGYESPALAFLAAREQGLLGDYDPKTGDVGTHDFEALEESHTQFATEAGRSGENATGDAGRRGGGTVNDPARTFTKLVRKGF